MVVEQEEKTKEASKPPADKTPKILTLTGDRTSQAIEIKQRDGDDTVVREERFREMGHHRAQAAAGRSGRGRRASLSASTNRRRRTAWWTTTPPIWQSYGLAPPLIEVTFTMKDGKTTSC